MNTNICQDLKKLTETMDGSFLMADVVGNDALERGIAQPLLLDSGDNQQDEDGDEECDGGDETPEESCRPVTSIASAYRLLAPSVKVCL